MNCIEFISEDNWFTLTMPINWIEYKNEEDQHSYYFRNIDKWTDNLFVHPVCCNYNLGENKVASYLNKELEYNIQYKPLKVKMGSLDGAFYKNSFNEGGRDIKAYNWILGKGSIFLYCSFWISVENITEKCYITELRSIITSINILPGS